LAALGRQRWRIRRHIPPWRRRCNFLPCESLPELLQYDIRNSAAAWRESQGRSLVIQIEDHFVPVEL
jgi:hypothetical protein